MSPVVGNSLYERRDARFVARLGRADEVVERDVEALPRPAELLLHLIAVRQRIESLFGRLLEHVLRVLVVSHEESGFDAAEPLVPRDHVGSDLLVRRPEVGPAVDVVDRGCKVEAAHEGRLWLALKAETAMRLHFLDREIARGGQPGAVVEFRHGVHDPAVAPGDLEAHRADRSLDGNDLALQTLAGHFRMPQADGRRLPKNDVRHLGEPFGFAR